MKLSLLSVLKESEGLTNEPILPRYRRVPRRLERATPHRYMTPKTYPHADFEAVEEVCGELENGFDQSKCKDHC